MNQVIAARLDIPTDAEGLPGNPAWDKASPITFCADWRGRHADPDRETEVRMLWTPDRLFIRFHCRFRTIFTYDGGDTHRDRLWMRDVSEIFIRPDTWKPSHYLEFEISPNGDWLDLDISPGNKSILYCGMKSRVTVDSAQKIWTAEIAIPSVCFNQPIAPHEGWRLNLFRIEGREPDRFYSSWIPTHTTEPNFHVPELFGVLHFQEF